MLSDHDLEVLMKLDTVISDQGGVRHPDKHERVQLIIDYPDDVYENTEKQPQTDAMSCGCEYDTQFVVPYDHEGDGAVASQGVVTLCAICDMLPIMARFEQGMEA